MKIYIKIFYAATCLTALAIATNSAMAMTQVSNPIAIDNAVKGESYSSVLVLVNNGNADETFTLGADGEIADWTKFFELKTDNQISAIAVRANSTANVRSVFEIPADTANGDYNGRVNVSSAPIPIGNAGQTGATVSHRVPRNVTIRVTGEETIRADCQISAQNRNLAAGEHLILDVWCKNTGSVSIKPSIRQTITQGKAQVANAEFAFPSDKPRIIPNASRNWQISWMLPQLPKGDYAGTAEVMAGETIVSEASYDFQVGNFWANMAAAISMFGTDRVAKTKIIVSSLLFGLAMILIFVRQSHGENRAKSSETKKA